MNFKTIFLSSLLFCIVFPLFGQLEYSLDCLRHTRDSIMIKVSNLSSIRKTQSRPHNLYLNRNWQHSSILTLEGELLTFNGRFSVLDNAIQWRYKDLSGTIHSSRIRSALIGDRLMIPIASNQIDGIKSPTYLEVLFTGEANLYKRHYLDSRMQGSNSLTANINGTKEYFLAEDYYFSVKGESIEKLRSSKKKILSIFERNKEEIQEFLSEQNINLNSEDDLINLFDFYNQQISSQK